MSGDSEVAPIIIKRKKVVGGDGHHGGAWKVAYADFVTAMMAFFMLMWLLNATTEKQRKGIADYFSPTIAMARVSGGGNGPLGGESVFAENTLPRMGTGATSLRPNSGDGARGTLTNGKDDDPAEDEKLEEMEEVLMGLGGESTVADETLEHIVTETTDEGLIISLVESEEARLFVNGAEPTPLLEDLALVLAHISKMVSNSIAIEGHTAAFPLTLAHDPRWDVSGERAAVFRQLLIERGFDPKRVQRVTALADREPLDSNPMALRNNRVDIVFIRRK